MFLIKTEKISVSKRRDDIKESILDAETAEELETVEFDYGDLRGWNN